MSKTWAFWFNSITGAPLTGILPLPTVNIRNANTGVAVVTGGTTVERGDGWYTYTQSPYDPTVDLIALADAGAAVRIELWRGDQLVSDLGLDFNESREGIKNITVPDVTPANDYWIQAISVWLESISDPQATSPPVPIEVQNSG